MPKPKASQPATLISDAPRSFQKFAITIATAATAVIAIATAIHVDVERIALSRATPRRRPSNGLGGCIYVVTEPALRKSSIKRNVSAWRVSSSGALSNADGWIVASA